MASKSALQLSDELYHYLLDVSLRESSVLKRLRDETRALPEGSMQIAADQGQFMGWLALSLGVERALEVGVFTGYSTICIANALPEHGLLIACDISEEWTAIARRYWSEAGLDRKIDLRLAPATETLASLIATENLEPFDFIFIDADKTSYHDYYEKALLLVRPGGVVLVDNALWGGSVIDPAKKDAETEAIRAFNRFIHGDDRVDITMLPVGDGLMMARKK